MRFLLLLLLLLVPPSLSAHFKTALAGGIAGAFTTVTLYPLDTAKTLRQRNPDAYKSVNDALFSLVATDNHCVSKGLMSRAARIYSGVVAAACGSAPSSALYFGVYESVRRGLGEREGRAGRVGAVALSAGMGNAASSAIFVPKEVIKQRAQSGAGTTREIVAKAVREGGIPGLYCGYKATLLRNIPSAVTRFVLYEEIKRAAPGRQGAGRRWGHLLAGGIAGGVASALTTPVDVIKTWVSTGVLERGTGVMEAGRVIIRTHGVTGLYAGAGSRAFTSGLFSAVGFAAFEVAKDTLGVAKIAGTTTGKEERNRLK